ncbi:TPA: hypothetical protein N0F65_003456 [Lagenidium giganteum]|uniref:Palmitoyltransferase n=1 Tax=Lagenidium giganteum TaxID=4803 RepID=A0AAV2YM50_9STRA|nr:TPA: hypothetical protein N0F65_003456 [Lagenidium giganteum]
MGKLIAGVAVALMVLKSSTWLAVVRFHAPLAMNVTFVVFTVLMVWCYVLAMHVQPLSQRPPHFDRSSAGDMDDEAADATRYCERCDQPKPLRVHHCSQCQRCVFRMDHHCPWTSNCVGWNNKKYFLLFLLYTTLSCAVFAAMETSILWEDNPPPDAESFRPLLQCTWTLAVIVGSVLAGYFLFHMWLLYRGKTTLEYLTNKKGELEGYSFVHNVTLFCGHNRWAWLLPVPPQLDASMGPHREANQLMTA